MQAGLTGAVKAFACNCCITLDIMASMVTITHRIDEELKALLDRFCEEHGLKAQAVVQEALATWLEDAEDIELIEERRTGPWVDWEEIRDEV